MTTRLLINAAKANSGPLPSVADHHEAPPTCPTALRHLLMSFTGVSAYLVMENLPSFSPLPLPR